MSVRRIRRFQAKAPLKKITLLIFIYFKFVVIYAFTQASKIIKPDMIMKNKILKGGFMVAMAVLLVACNQKKEVTIAEKEQIKAEIQALENNFASIYNTGNADSLTYYADDAVSYFVGQKPVAGKAAIHQFIEGELKDFPKGAKLQNETMEIYIANDGNNVFEIGAYKLVDSTGTTIQNGHYFSLFAKKNGKFVCTRDMASSYPTDN
jgi:ketosteroid isomerase-like protein